MSKLTQLEMLTLQGLASDIEVMVKSYQHKQDSLQDFVHEQFTLETDEPETLQACITHMSLVNTNIEKLSNRMNLLMDHFK